MPVKVKYIVYCFLFWTAVVLLEFSSNFFEGVLRDITVNWGEVFPFATAWYFWFFFTFLVAYLGKRFPYSETSKAKFLLDHFLFFCCVNAVLTVITATYITSMLQWINHEKYTHIFGKIVISSSFYNCIIYAAIVIFVNSFRYYRDLQIEKTKTLTLQKELTESRLHFLQQQLRPHFLFNTHHSIITLMKMGEKEKSIEMMEKLSELMRFSLRENSNSEIHLNKELDLLRLYLHIQKIRFEDRLQFSLEIDPDLSNAVVPSMILQPIVENSIKYAVEKSSSNCIVEVKVFREKGKLCLVVEDRVEGDSAETKIDKGIGLSNTEERLRTLYDERQKVEFKKISQNGYKGFNVTIKIPLRYV